MTTEPRLVTDSPAGLVHRVVEPAGAGPHPTVVMLHGRSGSEDVMWLFARLLPKKWLLVAPRGIKPDPAGGYAWHPRQRDEWPTLAMFDEAVAAVADLIEALPALYGADPERTYLMGFSQGAATAYATAIRHPGRIQGIAGLVGFVPGECGQEADLDGLRDLPVFMAVGRQDELIPVEVAAECARVLGAAGASLTYREYDTGHRLNAEGMRDLKAWWTEKERGSGTGDRGSVAGG